jgi:hypothetical protein
MKNGLTELVEPLNVHVKSRIFIGSFVRSVGQFLMLHFDS